MPAKVRHGPVGGIEHPLVFEIINGLRTRVSLYRDRNRIFAGDAARCPRRAVLYHHTAADVEVETSASGKLYMSIGSAVHAQLSDALYNRNMLLFKEFRIPNLGMNLGGYIDDIILLQGKIRGIEIKTCGKLPEAIKPDHRGQALMYQAVTGLKMTVMYVSRTVASWDGKLQMKAIDLDATPEELAQTLAAVAIAHYFSADHVLPRIPTHFKSIEDCGYCAFQQICWGSQPQPIPSPTDEQKAVLMERVHVMVDMLVADTHERTNGILKHIQANGTPQAAKLLSGTDWEEML